MFSSLASKTSLLRITAIGVGGVAGCCLLWKSAGHIRTSSVHNVVLAKSRDPGQTRRKTRFDQFATIEADGQFLMTPADFLESVMHRSLQGDHSRGK